MSLIQGFIKTILNLLGVLKQASTRSVMVMVRMTARAMELMSQAQSVERL